LIQEETDQLNAEQKTHKNDQEIKDATQHKQKRKLHKPGNVIFVNQSSNGSTVDPACCVNPQNSALQVQQGKERIKQSTNQSRKKKEINVTSFCQYAPKLQDM
jgi:hypothetical protein